jgi:hypothetical protein
MADGGMWAWVIGTLIAVLIIVLIVNYAKK